MLASAIQQSAATILLYPIHRKGPRGESIFENVSSRFVLHAIEVIDATGVGRPVILTADNQRLETISVWHENEAGSLKFGRRTVIDRTLADVHALCIRLVL